MIYELQSIAWQAQLRQAEIEEARRDRSMSARASTSAALAARASSLEGAHQP